MLGLSSCCFHCTILLPSETNPEENTDSSEFETEADAGAEGFPSSEQVQLTVDNIACFTLAFVFSSFLCSTLSETGPGPG